MVAQGLGSRPNQLLLRRSWRDPAIGTTNFIGITIYSAILIFLHPLGGGNSWGHLFSRFAALWRHFFHLLAQVATLVVIKSLRARRV